MIDLVIRGGTVVDGTGSAARTADVAVDGGLIVEVGRVSTRARREIDASGLLVTPGFVDMHTHYDAQVTWDPFLSPSSEHGCTTVVMGNCGVGFAPAAPEKRDWLIALMEGVEDIPGAAMHEGIEWAWESFPQYLDAIEGKPHLIDFGTQVPHGALRAYVMGERGAANEEATAEDIAIMARLVGEGIEAGALGFSTSRTMLHKSIYGEPVPGTFASPAEIFGIGRELGRLGKGVYQLAIGHLQVPESFGWMKTLADEIQRPVLFNISQTDEAPELWRDLVRMLDEAERDGTPIYGQAAGRAIGIVMNWELTAHPFVAFPSWLQTMGKTRQERRAMLRDPAFRARLLSESPMNFEDLKFFLPQNFDGEFATFVTRSFDKMYPLNDRVDYEPTADQSVAALALATGRSPLEIAYDAMAENDGEGMLYFPLFNYADKNLDMLRILHAHPRTRMGLSDGGAPCGAICDGGMPTFMLTHWTRDRSRGERLGLEHVIMRQTSATARTYGLMDRGVLAPGFKADLNIIDYDRLRFLRPEVVYDLPAGGRRLLQHAEGYVATICGGQPIYEHGQPTGATPGRLIRGAQRAPRP